MKSYFSLCAVFWEVSSNKLDFISSSLRKMASSFSLSWMLSLTRCSSKGNSWSFASRSSLYFWRLFATTFWRNLIMQSPYRIPGWWVLISVYLGRRFSFRHVLLNVTPKEVCIFLRYLFSMFLTRKRCFESRRKSKFPKLFNSSDQSR